MIFPTETPYYCNAIDPLTGAICRLTYTHKTHKCIEQDFEFTWQDVPMLILPYAQETPEGASA